MKKLFKHSISLLLAFALFAVPAIAAEGELDPSTHIRFEVMNPQNVKPGELAFIYIILDNPKVEYASIQSEFSYPQGWMSEKFSQKDAGIGTKPLKAYCQLIPEGRLDEYYNEATEEGYSAFSIVGNNPTENTFRFAIYDGNAEGKTIAVGNDALALFAIRVPADATPGNYTINAYDIWLATGEPNNVGDGGIDPFTYTVTVNESFMQGDVNGDGEVDVRDITALIDVIMNSITDNPRADVNADKDIDVRDITALIDIIMNS